MRDWLELSQWLSKQRHAIFDPNKSGAPIPETVTSVAAWQKMFLNYREEIDGICRGFAICQTWADGLTPLQQELIAWRLHWAGDVALLLAIKLPGLGRPSESLKLPDQFGESELLEWLLIGTWRFLGEQHVAQLHAMNFLPNRVGDSLPPEAPWFDWN